MLGGKAHVKCGEHVLSTSKTKMKDSYVQVRKVSGGNFEETPLTSLIIPIYNEADIIGKNLAVLCNFMQQESYELIVCDDCSKDETYARLEEIAMKNPRIIFLHFKSRRGKGGTIKEAIKVARGQVSLIMDADLSTDLSYIPVLIKHVTGDGSIVIAERRLTDRYPQGVFRVILSLSYNTLVRLFFRTGIEDHQCGFKGMRTDTAELLASKIVDNGFLFDTELIVVAKKLKMPIKTVKVKWRELRTKRKSNLGWLENALVMMKDIVRLRLESFSNN
jgi:glycosyltransferase involved in cell wall biosynthesis